MFAEYASKLCSRSQRGFLLNRFLIANVIEIDFESRKLYLEGADGALVLVDLAAAFPSVSHDYLFKVLQRQHIPTNFQAAVSTFWLKYSNS